jgi:hypothetical protein
MPTKNPRINITLRPERHELLRRLAALQGTSMSGLISETMEMLYPVFERVCVVLEAAKLAQESSKEGLQQAINQAEDELLPMLYQAVDQFDMFMDDAGKSVGIAPPEKRSDEIISRILESSRSEVQRRGGPACGEISSFNLSAESGQNPRPVIRGSGSEKATKSTIPKRAKK